MNLKIISFFFFLFFLSLPAYPYTHSTSLIKWQEYSDQTFLTAKKENKPVFMLITAIWCHWCNVYEEKSLEDKDAAEYINQNYIPIFVDYDKRKDISKQYPASGLPITIILSPAGERLITAPGYIPKERLLGNLKRIAQYPPPSPPPAIGERERREAKEIKKIPNKPDLKKILAGFNDIVLSNYDKTYGGFGSSQKIPYADVLESLLYLYEEEKDKRWLDIVTNSLDHMAGLRQKGDDKRPEPEYLIDLYKNRDRKDWVDKVVELQKKYKLSGLYDRIDGGFFRYAAERDWARPHFEKLLSDNADIIRLYLHAYRISKNEKYKKIAQDSLNYALTTFYNEQDGRFYNSQRSDIVYYYLSEKDRKAVGPPEVDKAAFVVSQSKMIITLLHAADTPPFIPPLLRGDTGGLKDIALSCLQFIYKNMVTENGVLSYYDPAKKEKGLTGQLEDNLWAILAFKEAYLHTKNKEYLDTAETLAQFVVTSLYDKKQGGFYEWRIGEAKGQGSGVKGQGLGEKAYLLNGLAAYTMLELYKLTNKEEYLKTAKETISVILPDKNKPSSPYFQRSAGYLIKGLSK